MNDNQPSPNAEQFEELHDRLIDQSLHELLGNQQPPDLSARILAAAASTDHAPAAGATAVAETEVSAPVASQRRPTDELRRGRWMLAAAAGLLMAVGASVFMMRPWGGASELAQRSPQSGSQHQPAVVAPDLAGISNGYVDGVPMPPTPAVVPGNRMGLPQMIDDGYHRKMEKLELQQGGQLQAGGGGSGGKQQGEPAPVTVKPVYDKTAAVKRPNYTVAKPEYQKGDKKPAAKPAISTTTGASTSSTTGTYTDQPLLRGSGAQFNRIAGPYNPAKESTELADKKSGQEGKRGLEQVVVDDIEYRAHIESVQQLKQRLRDVQAVVQNPNSRAIQDTRQAIARAEQQADARKKEIEKRIANALLADNSEKVDEGRGPGEGGDRYRRIIENAFLESLTNPLSTFSIDVDTASYANARQFIMQQGVLPPPDAVRIEEMLNYFRYDYAGPKDGRPFASHIEVADCPWEAKHKLVRVAIKGREVAADKRPQANLVFLIDVSGSMNEPQKLPLLVRALKLLTEQLRNTDRVAIVVYAGSEGLVLNSTLGESRETILTALSNLSAGGSTNGGAGINLAYKVAKENFIQGGINRVILCTDGDFNVGVTSDSSLERMVEEKAKEGTFLTVLGFGRGNFNDSMLEAISGKGNGNYAYVDNIAEARKVLVEQLSGTLMTIAKDVKIQIEFNPAKVAGYRLLGYEDRILAAEDFNNDKKDAGEIGSGHTVTALYEIVPTGADVPATKVDELKYQKPKKVANDDEANELLTLKIRYKEPTADKSQLIEVAVRDEGKKFAAASSDFQFAAAVAGFGMLLRDSQYKGTLNYDAVLEIATQHKGEDLSGYRNELLEMVRKAKQIAGAKK